MLGPLGYLDVLESSVLLGDKNVTEKGLVLDEDSDRNRSSWIADPRFAIAPVEDPVSWLKSKIEGKSGPAIRFKKGTTTLAFKTKDGIFVAADSRASGGSYVCSQTVKKIIVINRYMIGTMAGGAADCTFWLRELSRQTRIYEMRNGEPMSVAAASKLISNILYHYRGMGISIGSMIAGRDKTGYKIYYIDSDGERLVGDLFSVGSGSTHAYGILDSGYDYNMSIDDAIQLARMSIFHAQHRDVASGGFVSIYHINEDGWRFVKSENMSDIFYETIGQI